MVEAVDTRERLEAAVLARAAEAHAATAALAEALGELRASGMWAGGGIRSFGHWADINVGVAGRTASRLAAAAERLEELPQVSAAFESGALSWEKVAAIVDVATAATDAHFAELGRLATLAQLRRICDTYRRVEEADDPEAPERRRASRTVTSRRADDGLVKIVALLEPDEAAVLLAAIDARVEQRWREERPEADSSEAASVAASDFGSRRADALVELATEGLEEGPQPVVRGRRVEVVAHFDADLLGGVRQDGRAWIEGVGSVTASTIERLLCDCTVTPVLEQLDGTPLDWGRRRRVVSNRQRRALHSRDGGCRFPGCSSERFVDAHHIVPWTAGGPTDLSNLVLLCGAHHRLFHEGRYTIEVLGADTSPTFRFRQPGGRVVEPPPLRRSRPTGRRPEGCPRAGDRGSWFDLGVVVEHLLRAG